MKLEEESCNKEGCDRQCYWVGQKFHSGFSVLSLWKNQKNFLTKFDTCCGKVTEDEKFNDAIG